MPLGSRSVTLREVFSLFVCVVLLPLLLFPPGLPTPPPPLLLLLVLMVLLLLPLLMSLLLLLLLLVAAAVAVAVGEEDELDADCCWRWATTVKMDVLLRRRERSRTWKEASLLLVVPRTGRLSVTPPVKSAKPSSVVPYFNAS